jgi:hypothetical protein
MKNNVLVIALVTLLIGAGGGFFAGTKYQQSRSLSFRQFPGVGGGVNGQGTNPRGQGGGAGRTFNRPVSGSILSVDQNSMTVKLPDGSSKIVIYSGTTSINQAASASATDLKVGVEVAAFGTTNPDGSMTAQNIQINPQTPIGQGNGGVNRPNGNL